MVSYDFLMKFFQYFGIFSVVLVSITGGILLYGIIQDVILIYRVVKVLQEKYEKDYGDK